MLRQLMAMKFLVYQFAKLVIEFIEKNNLKNVTLIGHSMGGGTISLAYKLRTRFI